MKKNVPLLLGILFANTLGIAKEGGLYTLWYDQPAKVWEEALPIGNGRLGDMVFGRIAHERLQLNDVTVWSGKPEPEADRPEAYKSLPEIRLFCLLSDIGRSGHRF